MDEKSALLKLLQTNHLHIDKSKLHSFTSWLILEASTKIPANWQTWKTFSYSCQSDFFNTLRQFIADRE